MLYDSFWIRRRTRYSFMDSELLSSTPNVNLRSTCTVLPVSLTRNVKQSDSSTTKQTNPSTRNETLREWRSTLLLVVWETKERIENCGVLVVMLTRSNEESIVGCAGLMVGYPLDTIKVHIQTQDHRNPKFKGTWHCFRAILARESMAGLYRGMTSPIAGVAVVNAIIFGAYGQAQRHLPDPSNLSSHFLAGAMAGLAQAPVCSPLELAKTRLQLRTVEAGRSNGPVDCLRQIYRNKGHRGIFNGLGITALREAPSFGVYFTTYEALTRSSTNADISTLHMLMAGGLAGTASWTMTYPVDVIKTRLQADATGRYNGAIDCFRQSIRDDGCKWLFRGLNSTIIRAFPTNAATFAVVTWTFRIFDNRKVVDVSQSRESPDKIVVEQTEKTSMGSRRGQRARQPRETFVEKCNSLMTKVMDDYNYESRMYCSVSLALISGSAAMKKIEKIDDETKRWKVDDADDGQSANDEIDEATNDETKKIDREHNGADEDG